MKHILFVLLFVGNILPSLAQDEFMVWTKVSVEKKIIKPLTAEIQLNTRFGDANVQNFFPQIGLDYTIQKWLKVGVEYRYIVSRNKYTNYHGSSRINVNLTAQKKEKRYKLSLRVRYQSRFSQLVQETYNDDFDQAIRLRPYFLYDIKKFFLNPFLSSELFFDPVYGPTSPGFTKVRTAIGLKLDNKSKHSASIKYQFENRFERNQGVRHVVSVSYGFEL